MPVFPNRVPDLITAGPIIEVFVFPPQPVLMQLTNMGHEVPNKKVIALIDTGASHSCIHTTIAAELGLIARDIVNVGTPSGISQQPIYDMGFALPGLVRNVIPVLALGANLENQPYDALIGRDILSACTFIYNGWDNSYQLHT